MSTAVLAVIRQEEHERIVCLSCRVQRIQNLTQQVVLVGAVRPIMRDRLPNFVFRHLSPEPLHPLIDSWLVVQAIMITGRERYLRSLVHLDVALGRAKW